MQLPSVLLVEDDAFQRKAAETYLSNHDLKVIGVENGTRMRRQIARAMPDLVLLDVMMPEVNGWEVCKYIKEREALRDTPVLMLTAIGPNLNSMTSPLYGADAYLDKPFDLGQLEETVQRLLGEGVLNRKA